VGADETAGELEPRLAALGAEAIVETLLGLESGGLAPVPQPEGATLAPKLEREDSRIDWTRPAADVHNLVRGTNPWPGAWTMLGEDRAKIHRTALTDIRVGRLLPGTMGPRDAGRLYVACSDRLVEILEIQRNGRARTAGSEFLNGLRPGVAFG